MSRRICSSHPLLNCVETVSTNLAQPAGWLRLGSSQHARSLSTTPALGKSSNNDQRRMRRWMKTVGKTLKSPTAGRPNYLSGFQDQPFPLNPTFRSHPVLSENSRTQIWSDIIQKGQGLKEVSAKYGVDIKRVAAVVRLKEVEKQWEAQGKPLARPYSRAVLGMLPRTEINRAFEEAQNQDMVDRTKAHEPTGDIHVHSRTMQQIFLPTSESRHFTRSDAAKAFGDSILPADKIVQIPELIGYQRNLAAGKFGDREEHRQAFRSFRKEARKSEAALAERQAAKVREAEGSKVRVQGERCEFRFTQINADNVGAGGRSRDAVGWKYGVPHFDRKKGQVKIPTRVGPKDLSGLV